MEEQKSLMTLVKEGNIEVLKELLITATPLEKTQGAHLAAYVNNIEILELLIKTGADINKADRGGCTCLHFAVANNNLKMIRQLLQYGAQNKANIHDYTPAHYAEENNHIEAFNLLVQHFLVAPFKPESLLAKDSDVIEDAELIEAEGKDLKKIESETAHQTISANTLKLLTSLNIKASDLDGIELEDIEQATDLTFLGKCLYFIVSSSLVRSAMLLPWMNRSSIKLAQNQSIKAVIDKRDSLRISMASDNGDDEALLLASDMIPTEEESESSLGKEITTDASLNDVKISANHDMYVNESKIIKSKSCYDPMLTTSGLLFESEPILRGIYAFNAFYETMDTSIVGIWNAFVSSLIIHGVVNYFLYPDERSGNNLGDALGFTAIRNIGCVRSIKAINFLCSEDYAEGYEDILSSSLGSPYIWPLIAGIPLLFSMINAISASRQANILDKTEVQSHISQLKKYKPGFWGDGLGWLVTAAIPELFPPDAFCFMLPQPAIKQVLEKITRTIIWDGRLSSQHRQQLFDQLNRFAAQRTQFTQMKAMSMLGEIVDQMHFKHLSLLQEEGVDDEMLKAIVAIKTKALKALKFLANHYNLPHAPSSMWRPLPRYLYANYLLWLLGHPQQLLLQPLFFAAKSIKWYYTLLFYKAIIGGVIEVINEYLRKKECLEAGNEWTYFEQLNEFNCTVCADFNLFYHDMFTTENCVRGYFEQIRGRARPNADIMRDIVYRDQQTNSWGINRSFNLNEVTSLILSRNDMCYLGLLRGKLALLLNTLKTKMTNLRTLSIGEVSLPITWICPLDDIDLVGLTDIKAMSQFIQYSSVKELHLYLQISNESIIEIANVLPKTNIGNLILDCSSETIDISSITTLAKGLLHSEVKHFELSMKTEDAMKTDDVIKGIAAIIARSKIISLEIKEDVTAKGCQALAEQLPLSRLQLLKLNIKESDFICASALIKALTQIRQNFSLSTNIFNGNNTDLFSEALPRMPYLKKIKKLNPINQLSISSFLKALPKSQLVNFDMEFPSESNFSILLPQLADAMNQSMITDFAFSHHLHPEQQDMLINFLPNKLRKINILGLYGIEFREAQKLFKILPNTNIEELTLYSGATRPRLDLLAEVLPKTPIKILHLGGLSITASDIRHLAGILNQSKLEELRFFSTIGNDDATVLFEGLKGSSVKRLALDSNNLTVKGCKNIAQVLTTYKPKHGLWTETANVEKRRALAHALGHNPKTNLTSLGFFASYFDPGMYVCNYLDEICNILPQTKIVPADLICHVPRRSGSYDCKPTIISSTNSLRPIGPYVLLFRFYRATQQFNVILYKWYNTLVSNVFHGEPTYNDVNQTTIKSISKAFQVALIRERRQEVKSTYKCISTETGSQQSRSLKNEGCNASSTNQSKQTVSMIDALHYEGSNTIVVDLNTHETVFVRGSINSNNVFIGKENSLLDVSQSRRTNFLQAGKNSQLRLGFFSADHIVVKESQGTIHIENFDSKDTLHLIAEQTVYPHKINTTICQNEIIDNDTPAAVIRLQGTTIQLLNTHCEAIKNNIEINNDDALYAAQREVMESAENQSPILYISLLGICETFLNSVSQSAWLTVIPAFAGEILYHSGDYTRAEIEKFHQELQTLLIVSIANSPHAMTASLLARWLAGHLTNSPQMIASLSVGASIVTSVMNNVVTTNASLAWIALQTGVGLMGSVVGSLGVQKLPDVARWGLNKINNARTYLNNRMNFWSSEESSEIQNLDNLSNTNLNVALK